MSSRTKRALQLVGTLLSIGALVFIALGFYENLKSGDLDGLKPNDYAVIVGLGLVCALANLLLCEAFHRLSRVLNTGLSRQTSWRIFGLSQIGKYLPGNIMHLVSRQALGGADGASQASLAKITGFELSSLALSGGLFFIFIADSFIGFLTLPLWIEGVIYLFTVTLVLFVLHRFVESALFFLFHTAFLVTMGFLFFLLLSHLGEQNLNPITVIAAYIVSWLVGFMTPGAPAGLGIREYILLLLLDITIGSGGVIMAVLLGRLINIIGDLITFFTSFALKPTT